MRCRQIESNGQVNALCLDVLLSEGGRTGVAVSKIPSRTRPNLIRQAGLARYVYPPYQAC